jgi:hypothetical protein
MPSKSAAKKENSAAESVRPARKTAPRVSTAKHRSTKTQEMPSGMESNPTNSVEDSREIIAAIAYGYWESRGCQGGDPVEDWVRAEAEYQTRRAMTAAA